MPRRFALLTLCAALAACGGAVADGGDARPASGWVDLFDGQTLDGWTGYASDALPAGWTVEDGAMVLTPDGGAWDADLVAPGGPYADFELEVEWWVQACGNSGIFYRGEEAEALAPIWRTALEAQVLDDTCHPDAAFPSHRAGGLYDLYTPDTDALAPGRTWHTTRVVADGDRIEHYLNGERVVSAVQGSADWDARIGVSKFRDGEAFPAYGTRRAGLVGLQDHGDTLMVRRVRIRVLDR